MGYKLTNCQLSNEFKKVQVSTDDSLVWAKSRVGEMLIATGL